MDVLILGLIIRVLRMKIAKHEAMISTFAEALLRKEKHSSIRSWASIVRAFLGFFGRSFAVLGTRRATITVRCILSRALRGKYSCIYVSLNIRQLRPYESVLK